MKAEIKHRIDTVNRTKLETVIPLSVPFIINVDPADTCNFKCHFCPTGDRELMKSTDGRNFGAMSFDLFKKIIDDISEFGQPIKVLRLYKEGEPLLNPNIGKMVKYAKDKGCVERIDTTTNASLLTPKMSDELIDGGLTRINISIEGMNQKQYVDFAGFRINFDKLVANVRYFYENKKQCEVIVKINGDTLTEEDKQNFYDTFGNIADGVSIEHIMSCWPDFEFTGGLEANSDFGIYGQRIQDIKTCPYIFYSFSINSNGSVSACFLDWERKIIIGDITTQSVKDIWLGEPLKNLQKIMLRKQRHNHPTCKNCGQMSHGMPDNIDKFSNTLLNKIT